MTVLGKTLVKKLSQNAINVVNLQIPTLIARMKRATYYLSSVKLAPKSMMAVAVHLAKIFILYRSKSKKNSGREAIREEIFLISPGKD